MPSIDAVMRSWVRRHFTLVAAAALLALFALQSVGSMRHLSTTFDETSHLPAGYTYLVTGDMRLNPQHPPLVKLLCATPLLLLQPNLDLNDTAWTSEPPDEWQFGYAFLYANDAERLLFWGRLPVVALALLLGVYVYLWASRWFGPAGGLTALVLFAFSPNVLAHSHLVTMDLALACFSTMGLFHLWRLTRDRRWHDRILAGVGLGLALASKFSAVVLLVAFVILLGAHAASTRRWRDAMLDLASTFCIAFVVVWATYGFPLDPGFYLDGVALVNADRVTDYPYFLMGKFKEGGWWYYFLVAFLVKTPLPTLAMIVAAAVLIRKIPAGGPLDEAFVLVPVALFVVMTSALADNLGVRYLLPVYPLLFVFVSRLGQRVTASPRWVIAVFVLAALYVAGAIRIYPHHLSYFNGAVGGPVNGHRLLDDSNIDWGQGLRELKTYLDREGIERVRLLYAGNGSPDYWGIRYEPVTDAEWSAEHPPPGMYAASTQLLIRGEYHADRLGVATDWLSRHEPFARVGYHTYIFRFGPPGER